MTSAFHGRGLKREQEPELFAPPPRGQRGETLSVYDAVVFLRKHGFHVFRISNRQNSIDGKMRSTPQLLHLAAKLREEGKKHGA